MLSAAKCDVEFRRSVIWGVLCLFLLSISCGQEVKVPVLAKFDAGVVTENEYVQHYLLSTQYKPNDWPTEENLVQIVTLKAMDKIATLEARTSGVEQDNMYQELVRRNEDRMLFQVYMRQEIIDSVISDSLINRFYAEFTPQYHIAYIMRPFVESSTEAFIASQKDTIEHVYDLLKKGHKFEELAGRYSQDITTNRKGGDIGWVIPESLGDAILRKEMITLENESYSEPIQGFGGFYIVYKGEQRDVEVPPIEQVRDRIWKTLYRTRRHLIKMAVEKRFVEVAPQYNYQIHNELVEEIRNKTKRGKSVDFGKLTEQEKDIEIVTFDGGVIRVAEIFEDSKKAPSNMFEFNERLNSISQEHVLALHARDLGIQNKPEVSPKLQEMKESLLRFTLHQRMVKDKAIAKLDSLQRLPGNESSMDRFGIEKELREELEIELQDKYRLEFLKDNFGPALKVAREKKEEQNRERETQN
jgi:hypothetical protein